MPKKKLPDDIEAWIKQSQASGHIAGFDPPAPNFLEHKTPGAFKGEQDWPVFVGYPYFSLPYTKVDGKQKQVVEKRPEFLGDVKLHFLRWDLDTHCAVCVRTDAYEVA